jgi:hypothetical protein
MARRVLRWLVPFLALGAGCGDVEFFFVVRTGTVEADADCAGSGGSFGLRDPAGLTVLVVITDDTNIFFASGGSGQCSDVTRGTVAEVGGNEKNGTIEAESIRLGSG